jgi:predicted 2-oxoglutarate/Fe(II)-dependent dioxygenase YbiX
MPRASILSHLGLFVRRGFLDAESCRLIRSEMASVDKAPARIWSPSEPSRVVDRTGRRTGIASVSPSTVALVEDQLLATMPALASHFRVDLVGCQSLQFYVYEEGDFFSRHLDRDANPNAPDEVQSRKVSVSILLNDGRGGLDGQCYRGGALVFHGHRGDPQGTAFEIPLEGEEGMFIAFPSDWFHEVRPVTSGRRFSIVTWFF